VTKPQMDDLEAVRKVVEALEGLDAKDKERVLRWAREKLGLTPQAQEPSAAPPGRNVPPATSTTPSSAQGLDIKSFMQKKNPSTDMQFAATVAYYYRFEAPAHLRKDSITSGDLQEACRQVDRDRLPRPAQTLVNAHSQGLLDRGERGSYVINTVGENLVAMALPSGEKTRPTARAMNRSGKKAKKVRAKRKTHRRARKT
jgi:hypothetical protein